MASSPDEQRRSVPLPAYNFRVTVDDETMSFRRVTGIETEVETVTYRHGLSFVEGEQLLTVDFDRFRTVTLERGLAVDAGPRVLGDWLRRRDPRRLAVSLCDEIGVPMLTWQIAKAVPTKLSAPAFDADTHEAAIEKLELRARGITLVERP